MSDDKLVEWFNAQAATSYMLWGFLSGGAIAVLGILYLSANTDAQRLLKLGLSIAFLALGAWNCHAMFRSQRILFTLDRTLEKRAESLDELRDKWSHDNPGGDWSQTPEGKQSALLHCYKAPGPRLILVIQIFAIVIILAFMWVGELSRFLPGSRSHPSVPDAPRSPAT
jgi:hypothetical protein